MSLLNLLLGKARERNPEQGKRFRGHHSLRDYHRAKKLHREWTDAKGRPGHARKQTILKERIQRLLTDYPNTTMEDL